MKSVLKSLALAALSICLLAAPALAWDEAKAKTEAQAFLDQVSAMLSKKDLPALAATALPETTIKYVDGRSWNMTQWHEQAAKDLAGMDKLASKMVVEKVWPKGKDKLGIIYRETERFTLTADPGHEYLIAARFRALLVKTPQGLRFQEFVELNEAITRDGKAFKPKAK